MMRKPDIALAKKELDWTPSVNLDKGLEKTIAFFKSVI
jgi:UDP-glucuronate decarboxylase